jgi:OOP family OmpA-OmpF porin
VTTFQGVAVVIVLAGGILVSTAIDLAMVDREQSAAAHPPLAAPHFRIESARGELLIEGTTRSAIHESALLALAADYFEDANIRTGFQPGVILSDEWEPRSTRLLYVLAATASAEAEMREQSIRIRGVTADAATFAARLGFLREELAANIQLETSVIIVESPIATEALCRAVFSRLRIDPISFRKSSAEIATSSYATLDRIVDFAYDCPKTAITITGYTDASGDAATNQRLSLGRAQAVADYMSRGGIDPQRFSARGLGSSQPVADNSTALGRSLNRRIEFELQ